MDKIEAKQRIDYLRQTLRENSVRYYVDNSPVISDFEYDMLMHELESLEASFPEYQSEDSPTRKVGSDLDASEGVNAESLSRNDFVQRPHRYPMLSLGNTYSIDEVEEFAARADKILQQDFTYCCELKFDGTAICLTYKGGKLVQALTRGDGVKGDDVTANVLHISNIPSRLKGNYPEEFEIRGEILMPYEAFDALNRERDLNEEAPFANPRNAASGSLKLSDPSLIDHRGLICTLYHIPAQSADFPTHDAALSAAASWGLPVSDKRKICHNIAEIEEYINYWDTERKFLPYATDGIVIKINQMDAQRTLGYTAKSPRWAVAYKFKAETACTQIQSISYQVGRTGAVTPVANLNPVQLSGTVVKRATLNNAAQMSAMDIRIGDYVFVEKGGEIIPKITSVDLSKRAEGLKQAEFPSVCPDCGTPLVREEGEAKWFCPNTLECPQQIKGAIVHFASRKAMYINMGEATVDQLYENNLVRTPADLYILSKNQLLSLDLWQEKKAEALLSSLKQSLSVPFERVLFAIGIRFVGESTAREIARHFGDIDSIASATKEQLLEVPDVGEVIAQSVYDYFRDERRLLEIERLRNAGLKMSVDASSAAASDILKGQVIVISGTFSISRDEMKQLIMSNGGKCSSSISSNTSFLLSGQKPGPEKIKKCEQLGVRVIDEDEFRQMTGIAIEAPGSARGSIEEDSEPTLF